MMDEFKLEPPIHGEARTMVSEDNTAIRFGSGSVDVFATPAMIALMEEAAINAVDSKLPEGQATVGTELNIKHMAATPVGMNVTARADLLEVEGRRLTFRIEAFDELEKIGEGSHQRYIIELERFRDKASSKSKKS